MTVKQCVIQTILTGSKIGRNDRLVYTDNLENNFQVSGCRRLRELRAQYEDEGADFDSAYAYNKKESSYRIDSKFVTWLKKQM